MATAFRACACQDSSGAAIDGINSVEITNPEAVGAVREDSRQGASSAGVGSAAGVVVAVKSPWPDRSARIIGQPSQRLSEIATLACEQLGIAYGPSPEVELSLYGPDLRELSLESTLEAFCGVSNHTASSTYNTSVQLHLLPYKALWEQYWKSDGAQAPRGGGQPGGDIRSSSPVAHAGGGTAASGCANSACCGAAGADDAVIASTSAGSHRPILASGCGNPGCPHGSSSPSPGGVSSGSQLAASAGSLFGPSGEPDWLPLYWHLWMSDPAHTAGMPAAPPDGCPPVSFVHDADTPLNVSLDVFAGWMGIPPLGQPAAQLAAGHHPHDAHVKDTDAVADANASGASAAGAAASHQQQQQRSGESARCLGGVPSSSVAEEDQSRPSQQPLLLQPQSQAPLSQRPQQPEPVEAPPPAQPSGCGSWCRHMEWLRGGGTRMLRLLAAATTSTPTSSSASGSCVTSDSRNGSGGGSSQGTAASVASSDRGLCASGSSGVSSDAHDRPADSGPSASDTRAVAAMAGLAGGDAVHAVGQVVQLADAAGGAPTSSADSHSGASDPAAPGKGIVTTGVAAAAGSYIGGLQLLWLNRQVSHGASPAELGMCDQSVVALLHLCNRPSCAACMLTRGSLHGSVELVDRALAAGGLGPVDEQQKPPHARLIMPTAAPLLGSDGKGDAAGSEDSGSGGAALPGSNATGGTTESEPRDSSAPKSDAAGCVRPPMLMPLGLAAANGHEGVLELLLQRRVDDPNVCDKFGLPALWFAVEHAQPGCVRLLLQGGARAADWVFASPSAAAGAGGGAASAAAERLAAERATAAAAAGLPLAVASYMALCHAVEVGDVRTVRELLRFGACPYTPDDNNGTPYHMAIERGDVDMVQALLDGDPAFEELQRAQADVYRRLLHASQRVERSEVAGCPCVQCNYRVAIRAAASPETEELRAQLQLVALPAIMDAAPPEAAVALMAAMRQRGALLDAHDADGYTALHLAVRAGNLGAIRWLLHNGADPQERDALGYMPLHLLAHYGCSAAPAPPPPPTAATPAAAAPTPTPTATVASTGQAAAAAAGAGSSGGSSGGGGAEGAVVVASGGQLELAAARLLVEDSRMPLGAKTTCFAYEADVRAEEKKLRAGPLAGGAGGASSSSTRNGRRVVGGATAASKKRSRDPMLTVPLYGGHTAAQLALRYGRPLLLAYLLHRGAPVDLSSATSRHCLEKALEAGHSAAARILLSYVQQGKSSSSSSSAGAPPSSSGGPSNGTPDTRKEKAAGRSSRRAALAASSEATGGANGPGTGSGSGKATPREASTSPPPGSFNATAAVAAVAAAAEAEAVALTAMAAAAVRGNGRVAQAAQSSKLGMDGPMGRLDVSDPQVLDAAEDAWAVARAEAVNQTASVPTTAAAAVGAEPTAADPATALLLERRKARRTGSGYMGGGAAAKYGNADCPFAPATQQAAAAVAAPGSAVSAEVTGTGGGAKAKPPSGPSAAAVVAASTEQNAPVAKATTGQATATGPALPLPSSVLLLATESAPAQQPLHPVEQNRPPVPPAPQAASGQLTETVAPAEATRPVATALAKPAGTPSPTDAADSAPADGTSGIALPTAAAAPQQETAAATPSLRAEHGGAADGGDEGSGSKSSRSARRRASRREARKAAAAAAAASAASAIPSAAAGPASSAAQASSGPALLAASGTGMTSDSGGDGEETQAADEPALPLPPVAPATSSSSPAAQAPAAGHATAPSVTASSSAGGKAGTSCTAVSNATAGADVLRTEPSKPPQPAPKASLPAPGSTSAVQAVLAASTPPALPTAELAAPPAAPAAPTAAPGNTSLSLTSIAKPGGSIEATPAAEPAEGPQLGSPGDAAAADPWVAGDAAAADPWVAGDGDDGGKWHVVTGHRHRRGAGSGIQGGGAAGVAAPDGPGSAPLAAVQAPGVAAAGLHPGVATVSVSLPSSASAAASGPLLGVPLSGLTGASNPTQMAGLKATRVSGSRQDSPPKLQSHQAGAGLVGPMNAAGEQGLAGSASPAVPTPVRTHPARAPSTDRPSKAAPVPVTAPVSASAPAAAAVAPFSVGTAVSATGIPAVVPGSSPPAPASVLRVPAVRRASSGTGSAVAGPSGAGASGGSGYSCGYIEVPRSLLYGKRGTTGQSPTALTAAANASWAAALAPAGPPATAGAVVAGSESGSGFMAPAPAASVPAGRPVLPAAPAAAVVGTVRAPAVAASLTPAPSAPASGPGSGASAAAPATSFAAAVRRGEASASQATAPSLPPPGAPLPSTSAPSKQLPPNHSSLSSASAASSSATPVGAPTVKSVDGPTVAAAAGATAAARTRAGGKQLPTAAAATGKIAAGAGAGPSVSTSVVASGSTNAGGGASATANRSSPSASSGSTTSSTTSGAGSGAAPRTSGSGAEAWSSGAAGQPSAPASKLNPQAHEFVPVRTSGSAGSGPSSSKQAASAAAAGSAVHLSVPGVQVATAAVRPGDSWVAAAGGTAAAAAGDVGLQLATATSWLSLSPSLTSPGRHSAVVAASPVAGSGDGSGGGHMSYTMSYHGPASTLPPQFQAQHGTALGPGQQPPASPVAQVMSWQAVQPIQVLSSPIRRLPDLPDLYRAMVSPYCSYIAHSPRATSGAGAAAAAAAAAANAAAVTATAAMAAAAAAAAEASPAQPAASGGEPAPAGVSPDRQNPPDNAAAPPAYNPLAAPLPQLSLLPHGLYCGEHLIRPTSTRLWGLDPLQQLRATQTSLDATIAAAFNMPAYLAATQAQLAECAAGGCSDIGGSGVLMGGGGMWGTASFMGPYYSSFANASGGGAGAGETERLSTGGRLSSSGGGAGSGVGSGIVRALHSIFAEEELEGADEEEERQQQLGSDQACGAVPLAEHEGALRPPSATVASKAKPGDKSSSSPGGKNGTTTWTDTLGSSGGLPASGNGPLAQSPPPPPAPPPGPGPPGFDLVLARRSTPSAAMSSQSDQPSQPGHHQQQQPHPGGRDVREVKSGPLARSRRVLPAAAYQPQHPHAHPQRHPLWEAPGRPRQQRRGSGGPPGVPPGFSNDWRAAVISLFSGACTPSTPAAAQPAVTAAALWWTAVRQAPEPQSTATDETAAAAAAGGGGPKRPHRHSGSDVTQPAGPHHPHAQHMRPGGEGGGVSNGWGPGSGGGIGGLKRSGSQQRGSSEGGGGGGGVGYPPPAQGLVVLTQRVQVVGPLDADSMIAACLQGRLVPHTEICGTVAGLVGPPPLELFEPLGALLRAVQSGGGCYLLVEGW